MKKIIYLPLLIVAITVMAALSGCGDPPTSGKKGGVHPPATAKDINKNTDDAKGSTNAVQAPAKEALVFVLGFGLCVFGGLYVSKRFRSDLTVVLG